MWQSFGWVLCNAHTEASDNLRRAIFRRLPVKVHEILRWCHIFLRRYSPLSLESPDFSTAVWQSLSFVCRSPYGNEVECRICGRLSISGCCPEISDIHFQIAFTSEHVAGFVWASSEGSWRKKERRKKKTWSADNYSCHIWRMACAKLTYLQLA